MKKIFTLTFIALFFAPILRSQITKGFDDKFRQLEEILPTPNNYRTGSGAPGHQYWQQQADYKITAELNDENQSLSGEESIVYTNKIPNSELIVFKRLRKIYSIFNP